MSLVVAVPSYIELVAEIGRDVIVIGSGLGATRLRLEDVSPVRRGSSVLFRALLSGPVGEDVRNGTHLARVGDFLVRLRLDRVGGDDAAPRYEARAQAHLEELALVVAS
jgi:hypothetical protein